MRVSNRTVVPACRPTKGCVCVRDWHPAWLGLSSGHRVRKLIQGSILWASSFGQLHLWLLSWNHEFWFLYTRMPRILEETRKLLWTIFGTDESPSTGRRTPWPSQMSQAYTHELYTKCARTVIHGGSLGYDPLSPLRNHSYAPTLHLRGFHPGSDQHPWPHGGYHKEKPLYVGNVRVTLPAHIFTTVFQPSPKRHTRTPDAGWAATASDDTPSRRLPLSGAVGKCMRHCWAGGLGWYDMVSLILYRM